MAKPLPLTLINFVTILKSLGYTVDKDSPGDILLYVKEPKVTCNQLETVFKNFSFKKIGSTVLEFSFAFLNNRTIVRKLRIFPEKPNILELKDMMKFLGFTDVINLFSSPLGKTKSEKGEVIGLKIFMPVTQLLKFIPTVTPLLKHYNIIKKQLPNKGAEYITIGEWDIIPFNTDAKNLNKNFAGAGKDNEYNFQAIIEEHLKYYPSMGLEFYSDNKLKISLHNVTSIQETAADTINNKKADMIIHHIGGSFPISLKQNDASSWEGAAGYWGNISKHVLAYALDKELTKLEIFHENNVKLYRLTNSIAVRSTSIEADKVIFGSDLITNGAVIKQIWSLGDYSYDDATNTLRLQCTSIITSTGNNNPSESEYPYFVIRNYKKMTVAVLEMPGIYVTADIKSSIGAAKVIEDVGAKTFPIPAIWPPIS